MRHRCNNPINQRASVVVFPYECCGSVECSSLDTHRQPKTLDAHRLGTGAAGDDHAQGGLHPSRRSPVKSRRRPKARARAPRAHWLRRPFPRRQARGVPCGRRRPPSASPKPAVSPCRNCGAPSHPCLISSAAGLSRQRRCRCLGSRSVLQPAHGPARSPRWGWSLGRLATSGPLMLLRAGLGHACMSWG
jgi:hypothetical protein